MVKWLKLCKNVIKIITSLCVAKWLEARTMLHKWLVYEAVTTIVKKLKINHPLSEIVWSNSENTTVWRHDG